MSDLIVPRRIKSLPRDQRGFPVPWFVAWADGKPDFRSVAPGKVDQALKHKLCWVCGEPLGRYMTFVTGPFCVISGTAAEPPSHHECAEFSARACPFLIRPGLSGNVESAGASEAPAARNPGIVLLWTTREFEPALHNGRGLFRVGRPHKVEWLCEGRAATRAEVLDSLETGLARLRQRAEGEGPASVATVQRLTQTAMSLVPGA